MVYCQECKEEIEESDRPDEFDSPSQKGRRNELEAIKILSGCFKASEAKKNTLGHDFLGIADIVAVSKGSRMKFVQVKTNSVSKREFYHYAHKANRFLPLDSHADFEVWVRKDRDGWELYRLNPFDAESLHGDEWADQFDKFASIHICDVSRARRAYKHGIRDVRPVPDYATYREDDWERT